MKRAFISILICVSLAITAGCSKKDKIIDVADDEPEMAAAIAKGRRTLPQFWQVLDRPARGESKFALKVKITDKNGYEHFWLTDIKRRGGKIFGTVDNDPNVVKRVKLGDRLEIPEADISDWLYMRDGKMVGNVTLKPLFKKMPPEEVQRLKSIMADP